MGRRLASTALLALAVASARAASSIVYVTDMPLFNELVQTPSPPGPRLHEISPGVGLTTTN